MKWTYLKKEEVHQLHDDKILRAQINRRKGRRVEDTWRLIIYRTWPQVQVAYTMEHVDIEYLKRIADGATRLID